MLLYALLCLNLKTAGETGCCVQLFSIYLIDFHPFPTNLVSNIDSHKIIRQIKMINTQIIFARKPLLFASKYLKCKMNNTKAMTAMDNL